MSRALSVQATILAEGIAAGIVELAAIRQREGRLDRLLLGGLDLLGSRSVGGSGLALNLDHMNTELAGSLVSIKAIALSTLIDTALSQVLGGVHHKPV
jgi:hypothetical protein